MDPQVAFLLPLIGGSLFIRHSVALQYKVAREDGNKLYFRLAYHGLMLFAVSLALAVLLHWFLSRFEWFSATEAAVVAVVRPLLKVADGAATQVAFMAICLATVPLGRLAPVLLGRVLKQRRQVALWEAAAENELEELFLESIFKARTILATTNSGKVYVGVVLGSLEPRGARQAIALLPGMSGYRSSKGRVKFTTYYDRTYVQPGKNSGDGFKLVLPIDKLVSVSRFDLAVYEKSQAPSRPLHFSGGDIAEADQVSA